MSYIFTVLVDTILSATKAVIRSARKVVFEAGYVFTDMMRPLHEVFPNVEEVDLSGVYFDCRDLNGFFANCKKLRKVIFPQHPLPLRSLTRTFLGCDSLKSISLPELPALHSLIETFEHCQSLEYVELLSIPKIKRMNRVFVYCPKLSMVIFPTEMIELARMKDAFMGCENLNYVRFPEILPNLWEMVGCFSGKCNATAFAKFPFKAPKLTVIDNLYTSSTLKEVDFSPAEAECITSMKCAFASMRRLTYINFGKTKFDLRNERGVELVFRGSPIESISVYFGRVSARSYPNLFKIDYLLDIVEQETALANFLTEGGTNISPMEQMEALWRYAREHPDEYRIGVYVPSRSTVAQ